MKSPRKLLVANRSEIACRIFQACRELGIQTVGIYAPGDEEARHLSFADEVHHVSSYLDVKAIVDVAKGSGASLVHPGYGFLSERAPFPRALEAAGISFIGPTAETMDLMGGKIAAKDFAEAQGVPTLPWARVAQGGDLKASAKKIGFPLLLKAAAGGGGKGMRRVNNESELEQAAESASAEALASFGDGTLFLERLVEEPRHIEVQVFGDGRGGALHFYERECSLQRRHQKVWEEAQAPRLSDATKKGLYESAIKLTQAAKYRSAGTLEFLVDAQGGFYFLEMNTRLQVEHPVTEIVTGTDLVWLQIQQAIEGASFKLPTAPTARGHAIEVRIIAEDPGLGFVPTPGRIERLRWPTGPGIRVDSGIEEGQTIGLQFDSMIAKLICSGATREQAIARLRFALEETVILGLGTNQRYLHALALHPSVREGKMHTGFLGGEFATQYALAPSAEALNEIAQLRDQLRGFAHPGAVGAPSHSPTAHRSPFADHDSFFQVKP